MYGFMIHYLHMFSYIIGIYVIIMHDIDKIEINITYK